MPERKFKAGKVFWTGGLLILFGVLSMIPLALLNPTTRVKTDSVRQCRLSEHSFTRLMIGLATRAYELDRGSRPKSLDQLVPDYLDVVPVDPATGTKLP